MERFPKSNKNIDHDLDRLGQNNRSSSYNEHIICDWIKQYKHDGDRKSAARCERALMDIRIYGKPVLNNNHTNVILNSNNKI